MNLFTRVMTVATFAFVSTSLAAQAQTPCANCKPAAKTIVKTNYKYRTVQRVNNVTRYRNVQKVNNVYVVNDIRRVRVVRISYVMQHFGYKRITKAEYDRLSKHAKHRKVVQTVAARGSVMKTKPPVRKAPAVAKPVRKAKSAPAKRAAVVKRVAAMKTTASATAMMVPTPILADRLFTSAR
ncbi:MAG: hypothetical protein RL291_944 [Pseudomonadota bacterium]